MRKGERLAGEVALCALYLRGGPHVACCAKRRWPKVVDAVLTSCADLAGLPDAMRSFGLWDEAAVLSDPCAVSWALDVCESGRALTFLNVAYPRGWTDALGAGAPPCAWVRGSFPAAPAVALVGSRTLSDADRSYVCTAAASLMRAGLTLVSGGAVGTDSVAAGAALLCGGADRCVDVLPYGIDAAAPRDGVCQLSVCEPRAGFSTGQAMERNALIYAFGRRALVVRPRWRQGGTWHGAVDALRRRLGALGVYGDDRAASALVGLGARLLTCPDDVRTFLAQPIPVSQPSLFGALHVREFVPSYS